MKIMLQDITSIIANKQYLTLMTCDMTV